MNEKIYYSAEDIAKMLGVSMGKSYKILREMNKEGACQKRFSYNRRQNSGGVFS